MYLSFGLDCEKNKNKRNRGRDWPIFKKVAKGHGKKFYNSDVIGPLTRLEKMPNAPIVTRKTPDKV